MSERSEEHAVRERVARDIDGVTAVVDRAAGDTEASAPPGSSALPVARRARATKGLARAMKVDEVDLSARRRAACVLEVLAGVRSPEEAALALEVQLGTYFQIEERALRGLLSACGPQPRGRAPDFARALEESRHRVGELEREVQRHQALLRSAQRAAGVLAESRGSPSRLPPASVRSGVVHASARRTGRVPKARALRAVEALGPGAGASAKSTALPVKSAPTESTGA